MSPELPMILPRIGRASGIVAGYSTRHGGASAQPFDSLNLGTRTGDRPEAVAENQRRFLGAFGIRPEQLALAEQIHGGDVAVAREGGLHEGVDGLVTDSPGVALGIVAADCAVVLLADAEARVIGAAHSGWRGTVHKIVAETTRQMIALGAEPQRMLAFVGPCISQDEFEVGPEVAAAFEDAFVRRAQAGDRAYVDLKSVVRQQLLEVGLLERNLEASPFCTVRDVDQFFSYRAEGGTTGRNLGFVMLRAE